MLEQERSGFDSIKEELNKTIDTGLARQQELEQLLDSRTRTIRELRNAATILNRYHNNLW